MDFRGEAYYLKVLVGPDCGFIQYDDMRHFLVAGVETWSFLGKGYIQQKTPGIHSIHLCDLLRRMWVVSYAFCKISKRTTQNICSVNFSDASRGSKTNSCVSTDLFESIFPRRIQASHNLLHKNTSELQQIAYRSYASTVTRVCQSRDKRYNRTKRAQRRNRNC